MHHSYKVIFLLFEGVNMRITLGYPLRNGRKCLLMALAPGLLTVMLTLAGCAGGDRAVPTSTEANTPRGDLPAATCSTGTPVVLQPSITTPSSVVTPAAPPASPSPDPPANPSPSAGQPVTLRLVHQMPEAYDEYFNFWAKQLEEKSRGRINVSIQTDPDANDPEKLLRMVLDGAADIINLHPASYPDRFPVTMGTSLPLLGATNAKSGSLAPLEFMQKFRAVREEWKDFKVVLFWSNPPLQLHTVSVPVKTLADLQGLRLGVEKTLASSVEALGAIPVDIDPAEFAASVSQGAIDGVFSPYSETLSGLKTTKMCRYHARLFFAAPPWCLVMSLNKWNSLPQTLRKDLEEVSGDKGASLFYNPIISRETAAQTIILMDKTQELFPILSAETEVFKEALKPVFDKWTAEMDARGLDGKGMLIELRNMAAKACST